MKTVSGVTIEEVNSIMKTDLTFSEINKATKQRYYSDDEIAQMTDAMRRRLLIEWALQLDDINLHAVCIMLDMVNDGESWRTATGKAVEYLNTKPGYEYAARCLMEGLEKWEAKHGK